MSDDYFATPGLVVPPRLPRPGEPLFACIRASDRAPMTCELRFHGESFGWEAQFFERGEFSLQPCRVRDAGGGGRMGRERAARDGERRH